MSLPLHERIRRDLEADVLSGKLAPGARLPTEHALMEAHGCSRMTVHKALSALAAAGLIERRKRAGSFVARPRVHSMVLDIPDLEMEVERRGAHYRFALLERRLRRPERSDPAEMQLAGEGELIELEGTHFADEVPFGFERRLISLLAVPEARDADFAQYPPGAWLLRHVPWTEAELHIAAVGAEPGIAAPLMIAPGAPCLLVERRTWRGGEGVTRVRQHFVGSAYDLIARFGPGAGSG